MESRIRINSEIGKLKKVMLHRPGKEIENLVPDFLEKLLFDDIPYLKVAREEHDKFAKALKDNGVDVYYLEDLATRALSCDCLKQEFIESFVKESNLEDNSRVIDYLNALSVEELVPRLISGVEKEVFGIKSLDGDYPFLLDPMPNLYFTRDPGTIIGNGLSINLMLREARRREALFIKYIHKFFSKSYELPIIQDRGMKNSIEGGDILVLSSKVVAIGISERTSFDSIVEFANYLFRPISDYERIIAIEIPKKRAFMHLDTVFTMVDYDKFTIHPEILKTINVFAIEMGKGGYNIKNYLEPFSDILANELGMDCVELIECGGGDRIAASREQWNDGANTLAIAPGKVITYERNYITNEILDKKGIEVISIPSSELSRGRGGPRCMSMPLEREDI